MVGFHPDVILLQHSRAVNTCRLQSVLVMYVARER
jgi:hypothetical protein